MLRGADADGPQDEGLRLAVLLRGLADSEPRVAERALLALRPVPLVSRRLLASRLLPAVCPHLAHSEDDHRLAALDAAQWVLEAVAGPVSGLTQAVDDGLAELAVPPYTRQPVFDREGLQPLDEVVPPLSPRPASPPVPRLALSNLPKHDEVQKEDSGRDSEQQPSPPAAVAAAAAAPAAAVPAATVTAAAVTAAVAQQLKEGRMPRLPLRGLGDRSPADGSRSPRDRSPRPRAAIPEERRSPRATQVQPETPPRASPAEGRKSPVADDLQSPRSMHLEGRSSPPRVEEEGRRSPRGTQVLARDSGRRSRAISSPALAPAQLSAREAARERAQTAWQPPPPVVPPSSHLRMSPRYKTKSADDSSDDDE